MTADDKDMGAGASDIILPDAPWRAHRGLRRIVDLLTAHGGAVRFVGGAVRDTLLGLAVTDVDLATPLPPADVVRRLEAGGVKVVPTGIAHGTVTAVADHQPYEVTTLRRDVATDGRRATVAFASEWRDDAARRDFTINALYADPATGLVSDWFGGVTDLFAGCVRFIDDPATRIAEDHLRILRFYRFAARFGGGTLEPASHAAVVAGAERLKSLSRERVADELLKLLALADPVAMLGQMAADGIFAATLAGVDGALVPRMTRLIDNERAAEVAPDPVRRLIALLPDDADAAAALAAQLKLSNRIRKRIAAAHAAAPGLTPATARATAYHTGVEAARDAALLTLTPERLAAVLDILSDWSPPRLPVGGGLLVERGVAAGPDVARLLRRIEEQWIAEGFPDTARVRRIADAVIAAG